MPTMRRRRKAAQPVGLQPLQLARRLGIAANLAPDANRFQSLPALLQQLRHEPGPTRLMAGADARTVVAVEVFVEQHQVAPVRIRLIARVAAVHRPLAVGIPQERCASAAAKSRPPLPTASCKFPEPVGHSTLKSSPEVVMELLQRFDQQVVHREPDRPAPVRVAAEQAGARFGRLVVHAILRAVHRQHVGVILVERATARECRTARGTRSRPA